MLIADLHYLSDMSLSEFFFNQAMTCLELYVFFLVIACIHIFQTKREGRNGELSADEVKVELANVKTAFLLLTALTAFTCALLTVSALT